MSDKPNYENELHKAKSDIKNFLYILSLIGVDIKLSKNSNKGLVVSYIGFNDTFFNEHDIVNEPNILFEDSNFSISLDEEFTYQKPDICTYGFEVFKDNPHLDNAQVEAMYIEYNDELDLRAKQLTDKFTNEVNINLYELKQAIESYTQILKLEEEDGRTDRKRVSDTSKQP